ncbi:MAG TPA: phosphotransferase [Streptosporangiaceae bacterium]
MSEREEYAQIDQVADLIRQLHALTPPTSLQLPSYEPFKQLDERLGSLAGIDQQDAAFLRGRAAELAEQYERLSFPLGYGAIHGDANVGNVILTEDGRPVLIDLDSFASSPREWDLVQTALFYERFGWHTEQEYRTFVDVYGFDIMTWPGYPTLADYRELSMTLWLAGKPARASQSRRRSASGSTRSRQTEVGASGPPSPRSPIGSARCRLARSVFQRAAGGALVWWFVAVFSGKAAGQDVGA